MSKPILIVASFLLCLAGVAHAQAPDCRVVLLGTNTAEHEGNIVVAPSSPVTLEAHCNGTATPTYQWSTGATTFAINVTSPAAGQQQAYQVTVNQGGSSGTFSGTVRSAAAGTPTCTLTRVPAGTVPVFTNVTITATCPGATSYQWTGGYDLRGQGTTEVVHVNVLNEPNAEPIVIDVIASNASGPGPAIGTAINYSVAPPACRITAQPSGTVAPGTAVNLIAQCDGAATGYNWTHGDSGSSIVVAPTATTSYTLNASNAAGNGVPATHTVAVAATPPGLRDYTGHWYGGPSQDGWGITVNQHQDRIFAVIYFYGALGEPTWAVMPAGSWNANFTAYTGALYQPIGTPYTAYNANDLIAGTPTGSLTLTFNSPDSMTASYELGYSQWDESGPAITTFGQKSLVPLIRNAGTNPAGFNVADMWWGGVAQNGWGISMNQRNAEIFAAWFTYGADRRPTWFILSGDQWSGNGVGTSIYRVTGDPWLGVAYDPAVRQVTIVGTAGMSFTDPANGTFTYAISNVPGSKAITRQGF